MAARITSALRRRASKALLALFLLLIPSSGDAQLARFFGAQMPPILVYNGPTSGSHSVLPGVGLSLTTPGSYTVTVTKAVTVSTYAAAGGAGGQAGFGGPGLGGGGGAGIVGTSYTLSPGVTYTLVVGSGGTGGIPDDTLGAQLGDAGGDTSLHNGASYVFRLQGGQAAGSGGSVLAGTGVAGGQGGNSSSDPSCAPNCGTTYVKGGFGLVGSGTGGGGQGGGSGDCVGGGGNAGGNGGNGGLGGASFVDGATASGQGGFYGAVCGVSSGGGGGGGGINSSGQCSSGASCYGGGGGGGGGSAAGTGEHNLGGAGKQGFFYIVRLS